MSDGPAGSKHATAGVRRRATLAARPVEPAASLGADAIVVAAGSSRRMAGTNKLDHDVAGRPLLAHTLAAIAAAPEVERIVIVTAPDSVARVAAADWLPSSVRAVVAGGGRRHESVAAGLAALEGLDDPDAPASSHRTAGDRVVLVHDGARPLVDPGLVSRVAAAAAAHGAAIPVVPVAETLKRLDGDRLAGTVDRSGLAVAQTPQGVRRSLLRQAFERFPPEGPETWTDEAALLEACTIPVHAIPGDPTNLKVTLPGDLGRVDAAISAAALTTTGRPAQSGPVGIEASAHRIQRPAAVHVGFGQDVHPFGPGAPLALGGVTIDGAPRLSGHSDGDVVLHAVADAILGAARLGDLGRLFPAGPETPRGIASAELLVEVVRLATTSGNVPTGLDVTIVAARPHLAAWLPTIGRRIAALVGLPADAVNVKASTGNSAGFEGAGRGISAYAVATLVSEADSHR